MACESLNALAGNKDSIIGVAAHIYSHTHIFSQQSYVTYGVVLAFARSANDCYVAQALGSKKLYGLCLVVGLLIRIVVDYIGIANAILLAE